MPPGSLIPVCTQANKRHVENFWSRASHEIDGPGWLAWTVRPWDGNIRANGIPSILNAKGQRPNALIVGRTSVVLGCLHEPEVPGVARWRHRGGRARRR